MDLIQSVSIPRGAIVSPVMAKRGVVLRTARWNPEPEQLRSAAPPGTVVVCTGRSEFIEKYGEVVGELRQRGFEAVVFDWRGQGLSDRQLRNSLKGHVKTFADYEQDLLAIRQQILEPFCPRPWFALAHSMAGPIVLNYAAKDPDVFDRIVLSAPMIDIARLPMPNLIRLGAKWACRLGLGRSTVPVGRRRSLFLSTFEGNLLTSDPGRFARTAALLNSEPRLGIGTPTIAWLNAAFKSMAALDSEEFGWSFITPTLIVMPGADTVVDPKAAERLASRLRAGALVPIPGSLHEILMERDGFRQQFWSAFDAFIPGSATRARVIAPLQASPGLATSAV